MADVVTLRVKVRNAAKDYPAFGVKKGEQIFKWRAGGKKHISLTDPRVAAPAEVPVTVTEGEALQPKPAKKRAAKPKATSVTEDLLPE